MRFRKSVAEVTGDIFTRQCPAKLCLLVRYLLTSIEANNSRWKVESPRVVGEFPIRLFFSMGQIFNVLVTQLFHFAIWLISVWRNSWNCRQFFYFSTHNSLNIRRKFDESLHFLGRNNFIMFFFHSETNRDKRKCRVLGFCSVSLPWSSRVEWQFGRISHSEANEGALIIHYIIYSLGEKKVAKFI